ncbi:MAG: hypothetical protein ACYC3L_03445 [Gemmatimonadaceae bacterium]
MLLTVVSLCGVLGGACPGQPPMAADSLRIEYVCGNQFRVMNYDTIPVHVAFDVAERADSARHEWLPRLRAGQPPEPMILTTPSKGTIRLFIKGRPAGTLANGGIACPPNLFMMAMDSIMPESYRKLTDEQKGWVLLYMAAVMNDPLVRHGPLGPLKGLSRIVFDSLVLAHEVLLDSASANLAYERKSCLFNRASNVLGIDSVSRIARQAELTVTERHTRAELEAGRKGIAYEHPFADETFCLRIDSLWYARAAQLKKARK